MKTNTYNKVKFTHYVYDERGCLKVYVENNYEFDIEYRPKELVAKMENEKGMKFKYETWRKEYYTGCRNLVYSTDYSGKELDFYTLILSRKYFQENKSNNNLKANEK